MKQSKILLVIGLLCLNGILLSQTNSPYSRYGIGIPEHGVTARQTGLGGIAVIPDNKDFLTSENPAALYKINLTRIETGISLASSKISNGAGSVQLTRGAFSGFIFGVPVERDLGIGFALGIVPVSTVKYETSKNLIEPQTNTELKVSNKGDGGISKFFVGTTYKLPFNTVIGAGFNYYFGTYSYQTLLESSTSSVLSSDYRTVFRPRGSGATFGLLLPDVTELLKIDALGELKFSFAISTPYSLKTDTAQISHSSVYLDTTASGQTGMEVPAKISAGLSYQFNQNFTGYFEYTSQNWKNFTFRSVSDPYLDNSTSYLGAVEYRPSGESGAFWKQAILRAGAGYLVTPFVFKGTKINELRFSAGASLPLGKENTIDLGFIFGMRGTTDNGLLKENVFKFTVGLSLGELWFQRQER